MTMPEGGWDRPAIIAELHRRGMTLTGIAKDAGLYSSACRQGIIGMSRSGAEAIALALDIPFHELFPTSYLRGRHHQVQASPNSTGNGSPKRPQIADKERGAA